LKHAVVQSEPRAQARRRRAEDVERRDRRDDAEDRQSDDDVDQRRPESNAAAGQRAAGRCANIFD
jgi:hypothetical protein